MHTLFMPTAQTTTNTEYRARQNFRRQWQIWERTPGATYFAWGGVYIADSADDAIAAHIAST